MRLTCPNCGAQYEVDDKVIPDEGRDVQCSNCGNTWFQRSASHAGTLEEDLETETLVTKPAEYEAAESPEREPRGLDPDVAEVLREEAAREAAARRAESSGLETQPDLGLEDSDDRSTSRTAAARARMSRLRGGDESPEEVAAALAAAGAPRRELLPDIEEINSSLVASQDRDENEPEPVEAVTEPPIEAEERRGFRGGFSLVMVLVAACVAVYAFAPQISKALPPSEPYLRAYVESANVLRTRADAGIDSLIERVQGLISG